MDFDPQFSEEFKLNIGTQDNNFNLYYTKSMNDLISSIIYKSDILVYARLRDFNSGRLELTGIQLKSR